MAPDGPLHMPSLAETYAPDPSGAPPAATDEVIAVRNDVAQPGEEVVEIRYQRIAKGAFDQFVATTTSRIWPWEQKLGARPIGQWKVVHPAASSRTSENAAYDEVVTMTRYASEAHRDAMQPDRAVFIGGNGPDYGHWRDGRDAQQRLVRETSVELARGHRYYSPPIFMPGLVERYRKVTP